MLDDRGTSGVKIVTEAEWLACTDPQPMLEYLRGKASDRKLRLFACACCRRLWHLMNDKRSRDAADVAEEYADGLLMDVDFSCHFDAWRAALYKSRQSRGRRSVYAAILTSCHFDAWHSALYTSRSTAKSVGRGGDKFSEYEVQAALLCDIFGPLPFRPITLGPSWLTWHSGLLVSMARRMYDSRDFSDMPVLADALEESGCQDQDILRHCRSGGEHVRGCWVVDLLLGKE